MQEFGFFEFLAEEANTRFIGNVAAIVQTLGLVLPAVLAASTYVSRSRKRARDEVIEFFSNWNAGESRESRSKALTQLASARYASEVLENDEARKAVAGALNDYEFLAMFVLAEEASSYRQKIARQYFGMDVRRAWSLARDFISQLRDRTGSSQIYSEFERLAKQWED